MRPEPSENIISLQLRVKSHKRAAQCVKAAETLGVVKIHQQQPRTRKHSPYFRKMFETPPKRPVQRTQAIRQLRHISLRRIVSQPRTPPCKTMRHFVWFGQTQIGIRIPLQKKHHAISSGMHRQQIGISRRQRRIHGQEHPMRRKSLSCTARRRSVTPQARRLTRA